MKVLICAVLLALTCQQALAVSPYMAKNMARARAMATPLGTVAFASFLQVEDPRCPEGMTCCHRGSELEMCGYTNGKCCGNLGYCCPERSNCGPPNANGQPDCLVLASVSTSSNIAQEAANLHAEEQEMQLEEKRRVLHEKRMAQKQKLGKLKGVVLANSNRVTDIRRLRAPASASEEDDNQQPQNNGLSKHDVKMAVKDALAEHQGAQQAVAEQASAGGVDTSAPSVDVSLSSSKDEGFPSLSFE